ncbi:dynein axonemal heavy chain 10 isoform X1, partial [Tachysurus ichikawai]
MALDDPRLEWIRDRVYAAFYLPEPNCFEELLSRGDGEEERKIIQFLNQVTEEEFTSALLFFKTIREEEVMIPIEKPKESPDPEEVEEDQSLSAAPPMETPMSERERSSTG